MPELPGLDLAPRFARLLPDWDELLTNLGASRGRHAADVLRRAAESGRPIVQPRCGVGDHHAMLALLRELDGAGPGMLSVTIDSHTRLRNFDAAGDLLARNPVELNGYPLVTHGWKRGRELTEAVSVPLEVRHGSPDARELFAVAVAAGITSFEGGGIGYNLPYSKDVPLRRSLRAWQQVDAVCGRLARDGVVLDRELFGTLTAVLMPPSLSIAVCLLEAVAAAREGVRCISIAYPQGGEIHQDIAALRCVRSLARRYLPADVAVHPVLHEFMGVFPRTPEFATMLILYGGLVARLGGASKVVSKTVQESIGIPDAAANAAGIRTAALGTADLFDFVRVDQARVDEEAHWIEREVDELIAPVLAESDLVAGIESAFRLGRLDIPFSASVHARSRIVPRRGRFGEIRYADSGDLPFSPGTRRRQARCLGDKVRPEHLITAVTSDIYYFVDKENQAMRTDPGKRTP